MSTLRKSYSLSDLSEPDLHRTQDEVKQIFYLSILNLPFVSYNRPARLMW